MPTLDNMFHIIFAELQSTSDSQCMDGPNNFAMSTVNEIAQDSTPNQIKPSQIPPPRMDFSSPPPTPIVNVATAASRGPLPITDKAEQLNF